MDNKFKYIIGKTIIKIETLKDKTVLVFNLANGEKVYFNIYGGYCSCCGQDSWVEDFETIKEPSVILEFKEISTPLLFKGKPTRGSYFYELLTDKGKYMIEICNSREPYLD